jgi:hypothetical protein
VRLVAAAPGKRKEPLDDANAAFGAAFAEIVSNPDFRATAWILSDRDAEEPGGAASLTRYTERTNAVTFDASVAGSEGAWSVLSIVQDGGWTARDGEGNALAVYRANGPFLALRLPPGDTRVRLKYSPPGFLAGAGISGVTILALAGVGVAVGRRRARSRP